MSTHSQGCVPAQSAEADGVQNLVCYILVKAFDTLKVFVPLKNSRRCELGLIPVRYFLMSGCTWLELHPLTGRKHQVLYGELLAFICWAGMSVALIS